MVLEVYPGAKVVTNAKCKSMLMDLLHVPDDRFITVDDGKSISLGDKTLQFILAPWVHWPETMLTYLREDNILFTCDFLGSHLATSELFVQNEAKVYESAKRYYAEIMMPFRPSIKKNIEKIEQLGMTIIAPSHGPVYKNPQFIINAYKDWISNTTKNEVVIPYVSMHGSTERIVRYFIDALMERGIIVKPFNLTRTDIGELAMALVDAATIVLGTPTVLAGAHPSVVYAAFLANALRPKAKFVSVIGSYGWGGRAVQQLQSLIGNLKVEVIEPVLLKGLPHGDDLKAISKLADTIAEKHKSLGIM